MYVLFGTVSGPAIRTSALSNGAVGRFADGVVCQVEHAVGIADRFDQSQRGGRDPFPEHLLAGAEHERVDPQIQPVDEAEAQQRLEQIKTVRATAVR